MINRHQPAFSGQIRDFFSLKPGDLFLDLTLGDGGHTEEALESGARVVSVDVDAESIDRSLKFIGAKYQPIIVQFPNRELPADWQWVILHTNFKNVATWCQALNLPKFDASIADFGTSQYHFASKERGFSFDPGPLDMRLDQNLGVTARDLLAALGEKELIELFSLADERFARPIARAIVKRRKDQPLESTTDLVELIKRVKPTRLGKINPATKVFMALRMAVNLEREVIKDLLDQLPSLIKVNGTMGFISFHSGEDALVKSAMKTWQTEELVEVMTVKPEEPSNYEKSINKKIRSAKLRLARKIKNS